MSKHHPHQEQKEVPLPGHEQGESDPNGQAENTAENELNNGAGEITPDQNVPAEEQARSPEEEIAELRAQLAETRDQLLRKAADFENFRKRMNQEKQNAIEYANQSLLLDLIPVIDDFERAIQSAEGFKLNPAAGQAEFTAFFDGVCMIEKRLTGQLEVKWGLKRFNSAGELFDPNLHEALMMEKSPDVSEATVQEDLMKGYFLKDRVIRAAKVKVLMPETAAPAQQTGG